jgi:hypothetical protein
VRSIRNEIFLVQIAGGVRSRTESAPHLDDSYPNCAILKPAPLIARRQIAS